MQYLKIATLLELAFLLVLTKQSYSMVVNNLDKNISDVAIALSEIINGLKPKQLAILAVPPSIPPHESINNSSTVEDPNDILKHVDDFIYQLHKLYFKSVIFYDVELFFKFIEANLQGSIESVNLIFCKPYALSARIQERKLAHRLSLFIFYWGAKQPPRPTEVHFREPIRAVVITRPRRKAFRIYYNQAAPDGDGLLRLVNWYDADNLGLQTVPLLRQASSVYSNFQGRVFRVPVFHSPPWFWVNYNNDTNNITTMGEYITAGDIDPDFVDFAEVNVTGGRDHRLLNLLAAHMNFQFVYIDAPGRTQGALRADGGEANESFTGGIGLLQNGLADFLLGDVSLSWERRKAVEFSFFTLADSGAFATHAPRRLNEALAIIRPFKKDVWPYLILTILFSGPIFYAIIAIPYKWSIKSKVNPKQRDVEKLGDMTFYMAYIREITIDNEATRKLLRLQRFQEERRRRIELAQNEMPPNLFDRCIWFTVQLFLKQSCKELYHGYRAKFLMIVYWIAATYVLADVYSAQLTSQFARPAHESPINTLQRLQTAMLQDGYQLFVERESSSLEMLENGTEIFRHLYALMKQQQTEDDVEGYLIDSVESGIKLIADGLENKAVLGGRETLYFNIKQFGSKTFQLSQKLYTRYSAVAVQIGCPFLDSLNDVLIHLFEGGILDKMTSAEYETLSRMIGKEINEQQNNGGSSASANSASSSSSALPSTAAVEQNANENNNNKESNNGKSAENAEAQERTQDIQVIQPLNLRMLQGAFIILLFGYGAAFIILMLELCCRRLNFSFGRKYKFRLRKQFRCGWRRFGKLALRVALRILR